MNEQQKLACLEMQSYHLAVFAIGILNRQGRDNPLHAYSHQAMSNGQVVIQLMVYLLLVGATLGVFAGALV
jgi:hypothetical protein